MNKQAQIEERHDLTEIIYMSGYGLLREDCISIAEQIQEQGYRKQEDVVREITDKIMKMVSQIITNHIEGDNDLIETEIDIAHFLFELKKKYGVEKDG